MWLEEFVKPNRAPRTYCNYHDVLKLLPARIGNMNLTKLATEDVQRPLNEVKTGGHARSAALLRAVLRCSQWTACKYLCYLWVVVSAVGIEPTTY